MGVFPKLAPIPSVELELLSPTPIPAEREPLSDCSSRRRPSIRRFPVSDAAEGRTTGISIIHSDSLAALRFDEPLSPIPFPKNRVLHSLAHFPANSHIPSTY